MRKTIKTSIVLLDRSEYKNKINMFWEENVNFSKLNNNPLEKFIQTFTAYYS